MKPKISVVCPVWNRGQIIKHAIHGILDQSFKDWELLLIDDGSTDNTKAEILRFANVEPRIKYYGLPHTGKIGKVRNYGNRRSSGALIVVQDSDDISLPDRLEVIWREYLNTGADVLYHSIYYTVPAPEYQVNIRQFKPVQPFDLQKLLHTQYIPAQIATKREVALEVPYDEKINVSDDWMWLLELGLNHKTFHPIHQALYEYYDSEDSANILGEKDGRRDIDMKHIMKKLKTKYHIDVYKAETKNAQGQTTKTIY